MTYARSTKQILNLGKFSVTLTAPATTLSCSTRSAHAARFHCRRDFTFHDLRLSACLRRRRHSDEMSPWRPPFSGRLLGCRGDAVTIPTSVRSWAVRPAEINLAESSQSTFQQSNRMAGPGRSIGLFPVRICQSRRHCRELLIGGRARTTGISWRSARDKRSIRVRPGRR